MKRLMTFGARSMPKCTGGPGQMRTSAAHVMGLFVLLCFWQLAFAENRVTIECPIIKQVVDGSQIYVPIRITNDVPLRGLQIVLRHNSCDVSFISNFMSIGLIDYGGCPTDGAPQMYSWGNQVYFSWYTGCPGNALQPQENGLLGAFMMNVPVGTPSQCIDIDTSTSPDLIRRTSFYSPPLPPITPEYSDCGLSDIIIGGSNCCGDLGFSPDQHGWKFANDGNMWPFVWDPLHDPAEDRCFVRPICSKDKCFPSWELFREAFGSWQVESNGQRRPEAEAIWKVMKKCWSGSCFGFPISSLLFFDGYLKVRDAFPNPGGSAFPNLYYVPISHSDFSPRRMVNKYYFYQFDIYHHQYEDSVIHTVTPKRALDECRAMFSDSSAPRNDRAMYVKNDNPSGGHALVPYRCEADTSSPHIWYIYVYDCNLPGSRCMKVKVDTLANTWYYEDLNWGGRLVCV